MAEIQLEVRTYEIHYECDACGCGWLLPTGEVYRNVSPLQFEHKCNYCGAKKMIEGRTYPYTITCNGRMM